MLEAGLSDAFDFRVEGELLTTVGGTLGVGVLATPWMIGLMERCSVRAVAAELPAGKTSVGFEVCVRHVAGALEGTACTVHSVLREVIDGRKLRFDVEVLAGDRVIGSGTHERRLVDAAATPAA